jgi:hypothetical protein
MISYKPEQLEQKLLKAAMYQRIITLDQKLKYKLDLIVKDLNSDQVGATRQAILPPDFDNQKLVASSLILSNTVRVLENVPQSNEQFVLGDVKIFPSLHKRFTPKMPLGIYLHVYNASVDQSSQKPALTVSYRLLKGRKVLKQAVDEDGESTQYFSNQRIVLIKALSFENLEPGDYQVEVQVKDRLSDQDVTVVDQFKLVEEQQIALNK